MILYNQEEKPKEGEENVLKIAFENEKFGYHFIFYRNDLGVDLGVDLSETEFSIYSLIKSNNKITTIELVERIFKSPQAVANNLNSLKETRYIRRVGQPGMVIGKIQLRYANL